MNDEIERARREGRKEGYQYGWDANNEWRRDRFAVDQAERDPAGSLVLAITLTVFGGLFLAANIAAWVRWRNADWGLWTLAIVPLIAAFFLFRAHPKARRKAAEARAKFEEKWK